MYFIRFALLTCCIAMCTTGFTQNKQSKIKFGDVTAADFKPDYYSIDSAADAVYLFDGGSSQYQGNNNKGFSVIFKVHERIRLLHKKSFEDLATIKIDMSKVDGQDEKLDNLEAATYNLQGDKIVTTKVDKSSFFKDKDGDDQIVKFTFPDLKEGCIIEYTYTKIIPYFAYLPSFTFQGSYPELWSEYTIEVPQFFDFVVMRQGYLEPIIDTTISSSANFNILDPGGVNASQTYSFRSSTVKHTWAYKNVPALKEESFISDLPSYIQKVEFQLSAIRIPNAEPQFYMHTWNETVDQLMKDEDFGQGLGRENGWLKDDVKAAVSNEANNENKAKKIFEYVRNNYTCTDYSSLYLSQPLKKTEQLKKGNVVDINMLLIAMLKLAGYNADPVLLSTRGHGKTYDIYPILNKFNYLIARLNINNKTYFLDAANPVLGFGHLDGDCYNGGARVIATSPDLIELAADSLHESEVISLILTNGENGKMIGTYRNLMGEMQSESMRARMKKTNADDYFKDVKKSFSFDVDIDNKTIDSLKQPEMPVSVQYDLSFKPDDDIIYFTPVLGDGAYKENPFKAAERYYPVEMPYCIDETYVLNMDVPAGYKVDELPKPARVSLNDKEGMFEYLIQQSGDNIQLRCRTKINKATFEPDDYETLRNFFAFIVEKENEQIVFKKQ